MSISLLSFKRRPVAMIVVGLMIVSAGVLFLCFGRASGTDWVRDISSPDGAYRLHVIGKSLGTKLPYYRHGNHSVSYTLSKHGEIVIRDLHLYGGDQYDDLFLDLFPEQEWVTNSTVRFGQKTSVDRAKLDRIIVTNNGARTLDVVQINFGVSEILLTFDLGPQARTEFLVEPQTDQRADRSGVYVNLYSSGLMSEKGAGFELRGSYKRPATYYIELNTSGIEIRSDYLKKVS